MSVYKAAYTVLGFLSSGSLKRRRRRGRRGGSHQICKNYKDKHKTKDFKHGGHGGAEVQGGEDYSFWKPKINFCSICNDG